MPRNRHKHDCFYLYCNRYAYQPHLLTFFHLKLTSKGRSSQRYNFSVDQLTVICTTHVERMLIGIGFQKTKQLGTFSRKLYYQGVFCKFLTKRTLFTNFHFGRYTLSSDIYMYGRKFSFTATREQSRKT